MAEYLGRALLLLPIILLALTLHELGHAWVAERCGDRTARLAGRMTFNPMAHIDPLGLILLFVLNFGWARPVPVNPAHLRNPRRDMILVAAAGPAANLLLAFLSAVGLRLLLQFFSGEGGTGHLQTGLMVMLQGSILINLYLMVFNLLPIPPLDGSRVLANSLPYTYRPAYERWAAQGPMILFGLFFISYVANIRVFGFLLDRPVMWLQGLIHAAVGL
ncbi:MAG: site-2 protease family protein [Nitrospirae bacterium]|nr:site-2 protease family protein [Nitrospirota bacterium]